MRKHLSTIVLLVLLVVVYFYRTEIVAFTMGTIADHTTVEKPDNNVYADSYEFGLVQTTNDFHVKSRQDILNVIYTIINSGKDEFTFYCSMEYDNCNNDLESISQDQNLLSVINNMVSPYNSYKKMFITTNNYGKAILNLEKLYSNEDISAINAKIEEFKAGNIKDNMSTEDKVKAFHDYLVNNTIYDDDRAKNLENGNDTNPIHNSHKANGPLLEGIALCSGYSDAMKIYLDQLRLPNYKVSTTDHIWNVVYINGKWLHIDLTWDDPVTSNHTNLLLHTYFLIDTNTLLNLDLSSHNFDKTYYPELQ